MTTDEFLRSLDQAWRPARAMGALGSASIEELRDHAAGFVPAAFRVDSPVRCIDVGAGVGVPGLLLVRLLPQSHWTLVDASERRCDIARRAAEAVGISDRVEVLHGRVEDLCVSTAHRRGYDFVVSRSFAGFSELVECCLPLVRQEGVFVSSCSRDSLETWENSDLAELGGSYSGSWNLGRGTYVSVVGVGGLLDRYPRRVRARRRDPFLAVDI